MSQVINHSTIRDINVTQEQNLRQDLYNEIDKMLNSYDFDSDMKNALELFKYKMKANEETKDDANYLIEKLKKIATTSAPFASLASSIIGLIEKIF